MWCDKLTFIDNTKEPNGAVENDAVDIEQTILNVYWHLKYTKLTVTVFVSLTKKKQLAINTPKNW